MLLLILQIYLLVLAPLTYFQRSLIYHPYRCEQLFANRSGLPQATVDVTVRSQDGLDLHGWLAVAGVPSGTDPSIAMQALSSNDPVILFFPGNAGDRSMRNQQMAVLGELGAHVLLVDYRGYAENLGKPSETNFARDARSVWNHLTGELGVAPHRVVIYGESLGGGVATRLASELCRDGIEPGGLIVQSTFSSLVAVAKHHFWIAPVSLILVERFPSDVRIQKVTCPILQIHGKQDSIVPFKIGQRLFDFAPEKSSIGIPKRQVVMPNTDHNDVYLQGADRPILTQGLNEFLETIRHQPPSGIKAVEETPGSAAKPNTDRAERFQIDWTIIISLALVVIAVMLGWINRARVKS